MFLAAASAASAADWGVAQLFDALAKQGPARAAFQERKFMALLDQPVDSSGELVFTPPDRLEKRTVKPKPESVVADRDSVTLERGGKRRTLRLAENPQVAVLVESIRATLAGDLASLTRTYSAAVDGNPARWHLVLRPLDPTLATLVERIEIGGNGADVRTVEIFQADGDRSVMTLAPLAK
jgi:Outer membrane lipoprotein carrier protein LolA-like